MLIFDGACGFCTWAAQWIQRLDRYGHVAIVPFQKPNAPERVGLTREQCEKAAWAVEPDGTRYRGAAAIYAALAWALGCPWLLHVYRLPLIRSLVDVLYFCIAATRKWLPGVVPYCEQHPEECR
jgi:predicted DCC family thiol-disulfide oxidoreductase YuxK